VSSSIADHPDVRAGLLRCEAWIEAHIVNDEVPSVAVAIVHDQTLVWSRAFGEADIDARTPATTDTLYRIGSITKLFTATALLQLRDAGTLRLDDPVKQHVPWFDIPSAFGHGSDEVTIRHLLTHTAGLPRESAFPYWHDFAFPTTVELRDALARQSAILPLDQQWKYSNLAFALAGAVITGTSDVAYADYVRTRILEPLGMTRTRVEAPAEGTVALASGYGRRLPGRRRKVRPICDMRALASAGNMTSTVHDLAKFAMLQFRLDGADGTAVVRGATLREMQRVHWLDPTWQAGWGLGFRVFRDGEQTCVGHGGLVPGHAAHVRLIPEAKVGIIVLTNAEDTAPHEYTHRLMRLLLPAMAQAARSTAKATAVDSSWTRYTGRYRGDWGDVQILLTDQGLEVIAPLAEDPMYGRITLTPVTEHTFRMSGNDGYDAPGELVTFELGGDGRVVTAHFASEPIFRVAAW
jgi:CubicO group peptidase (beta-lactamase class C family)